MPGTRKYNNEQNKIPVHIKLTLRWKIGKFKETNKQKKKNQIHSTEIMINTTEKNKVGKELGIGEVGYNFKQVAHRKTQVRKLNHSKGWMLLGSKLCR